MEVAPANGIHGVESGKVLTVVARVERLVDGGRRRHVACGHGIRVRGPRLHALFLLPLLRLHCLKMYCLYPYICRLYAVRR